MPTNEDKANLCRHLRSEENCVLHIYKDSKGFWTIGIGHLIGKTWADVADFILVNNLTHISKRPFEEAMKISFNQNSWEGRHNQWECTQAQADAWFAEDVDRAIDQVAKAFPWLDQTGPVWGVFVSMAYQMGITGLLGFKDMIDNARMKLWPEAGMEIINSEAFKQTSLRMGRNALMLYLDEWIFND